ncbi:MAG: CoA transferase [Acidimicrobiales bacterium]
MAGLLEGVRVLDLSVWRPGPYATQLLVEMGADVVKVEPPGGDPMRVFPALFADLNAGKRSAAVDLKAPVGRAAVLERATGADVVIEGFRPGVAARLGVGEVDVRAVNPTVVYCSISGYGQDGPLVAAAGHDINYQAWAGVLEPPPDGGEPVVARPPIADLAGGAYAAMAVCAALVRRGRSGQGESIDVAMADVLASWTGAVPPLTLPDGRRLGGRVAGYGLYRARDGWITLGVLTEDHLWAALVGALGLDDVADLDVATRTAQVDDLEGRLQAAVAGQPRDELVDTLLAAGVPAAPVLTQAEMLSGPALRNRGTVVSGPDGAPMVRHPVHYRDHPATTPFDVPALVEGEPQLPAWR